VVGADPPGRPTAPRREALLRIVPRRAQHDAFIAGLAERAFAEYSPRSGEHTLAMTRRRRAVTLVAVEHDVPVGFAILQRDVRVGHLDAIAVEDGARGTGVGRRLLAQVQAEGKGRGLLEIRLVTAQANLAALQLFFAQGFRFSRRLWRFYSNGQDAVMLTKRLL
jgi:ribosomal protein S18 acetylase RimI-like enzyme